MIRYTLRCDKGHEFESWFQSSSAYDSQAKRGLVACPVCDSVRVEKSLMTPALARTRKKGAPKAPVEGTTPASAPEAATPVALAAPEERELRQKLKELRDHFIKNADYVGPKFPEEARKMHNGETDRRSIYGEASLDEAKELIDEGIEFHPLPILPEDRN